MSNWIWSVSVIINMLCVCMHLFIVLTYLLQLNRYEIITTIKTCPKLFVLPILSLVAIDIFGIVISTFISNFVIVVIIGYILFLLRIVYSYIFINRLFIKSKLVFTKRVVRQVMINLALLTLIIVVLHSRINFIINFLTLVCLFVYWLSFMMSKTIEYLIAKKYIYATKRKLNIFKNIKIIGITGSYGKTTTKEFLAKILSAKYVVASTPKSYNTPMGICKFILGIDLKNIEYLIIEMGAVRVGDIKVLCNLVDPDIGIITGISNQHLATFKTIDNIIKEKMELVDYVSRKNGLCFFNVSNKHILSFYNKFKYNKKYAIYDNSNMRVDTNIYNNDKNIPNNVFSYTILDINILGAKFKYFDINTKLYYYLSTMIFSIGLIENIVLSVLVSNCLGVGISSIIESVSHLEYIENRLELRKSLNGAVLIYDAYNSNELSFYNMLGTIANFNYNNKILITPGVVELGSSQYDINKTLAYKSSNTFNEIWVINKMNKYAFIDGVSIDSKCKLVFFDGLDKSVFDKVELLASDTLVVFENDLPDCYK